MNENGSNLKYDSFLPYHFQVNARRCTPLAIERVPLNSKKKYSCSANGIITYRWRQKFEITPESGRWLPQADGYRMWWEMCKESDARGLGPTFRRSKMWSWVWVFLSHSAGSITTLPQQSGSFCKRDAIQKGYARRRNDDASLSILSVIAIGGRWSTL